MLLTRTSDSIAAAGPRLRRLAGVPLPDDGPADVFEAFGPRCRGRGVREPASLRRHRQGRGGEGGRGDQGRSEAHGLHPLLGRLRRRRHRRERRVDAAGAGVRLAAQSRRALREGRVGPRARHTRALDAAQDADEARQRQVPEDQLGAGDQRDRRQDARAAQGVGPRRRVLGRQLEAQQRAGVPDAQVRVVLGHQQHRPPGADLPLDDGRRRSQHLGLRRDDQLVQRHAEHEVRDVHRQQRRRGAPGVDAAHAACEGDRREDDRRRSALHAHRGQGATSTCASAPAPTSRSCSGCCYHIFKNGWEDKQYLHDRVYGMEKVQGRDPRQVDARQGRGSLRRARGAGREGRRDDGEEQAVDRRLVHGPDAAHDRQRDGPRVVHPAARARQRRRVRRRHQHLPRPRQRAGRHRRRSEPRFAAGLLRPGGRLVAALRRGVGRRLRVAQEAVRRRHDGKARHDGVALDRRRAGEERPDRPGPEPARARVLGPRAEQPDARQGDGRGDEEARPARRHRPVPVGDGGDGGDGAQGRRLPAAGRDAVRDLRLGHRVEPLDPVARARDQPAVRVADRPRDHVRVREEVRLGQGIHQELQDRQAGPEQVRRAGAGIDPARDQQECLDDRLHRAVAGAAEAAHEAHADVRREDAARQGRALRRRFLRPAVAVLRHARAQASRARRTSTTRPWR